MHHMLLRQQFSGTTTSQSTTTMTSVRNARQGGCDSGGRRDPQQEEKQQEDDTSDGNPELDLLDQDEDDQDSGLNQGTDAREPPMKKAWAQMLDALKKFILYTTPLCESTDTTKAVLSFLVYVMQAYEGTAVGGCFNFPSDYR
ncbi:hypothetical protein Pelo_19765 [Pelomyxa schiedti]|nr:hypothetical protein Pelo_19765 [Pelomyxa schiedti]